MSNVTHLKKPCDLILNEAISKYEEVMVIGWVVNEGGVELSSNMSNADMILLMELVKGSIIEAYYED